MYNDVYNLRFQCIICSITIKSYKDLASILKGDFQCEYSKFDIKLAIETMIKILKQEDINPHEYFTGKSKTISKMPSLGMPSNIGLQMIKRMASDNISEFNDSLRSKAGTQGTGDRKFKNAEIIYNEEQSGVCDEIISEE